MNRDFGWYLLHSGSMFKVGLVHWKCLHLSRVYFLLASASFARSHLIRLFDSVSGFLIRWLSSIITMSKQPKKSQSHFRSWVWRAAAAALADQPYLSTRSLSSAEGPWRAFIVWIDEMMILLEFDLFFWTIRASERACLLLCCALTLQACLW